MTPGGGLGEQAAIPTSGVGRRRAKAVANRRRVHAMENDRAVAAGGLPVHVVALSVCGCGRISWLEDGASADAWADFDRDNDDHDSYCEAL